MISYLGWDMVGAIMATHLLYASNADAFFFITIATILCSYGMLGREPL